MKSENILDAIGSIDEEAVREAKAYIWPKARGWVKWGAAAACLCLAVVGACLLRLGPYTMPALSGTVHAQVVKTIGTGRCTVRVTGEDENFAQGDVIRVNYGGIRSNAGEADVPLSAGDLVSVPYTGVEKIGNEYEVTAPYVEIVAFPGSADEKTEYNRQIYEIEPFEVRFQLPEGWSIGSYDPQAVRYLYNGVWSRAGLYDADGNCVGAIGYNIYDADEYVAGEPMSIYHQIALGNDYQFNVHGTYTVVKETERYQTATADVYYAPGFADEVGADGTVNYGILSCAVGQTVYIALELDRGAVTPGQVQEIAASLEFVF